MNENIEIIDKAINYQKAVRLKKMFVKSWCVYKYQETNPKSVRQTESMQDFVLAGFNLLKLKVAVVKTTDIIISIITTDVI